MRKSQSLIIQFVIFFVIGFSLFLAIGMFFRYQLDIHRSDIADYSLKLANSYISSAAISLVDTCKQCDFAKLTLETESTTAGYFFEFNLSSNVLNVSTMPQEKHFSSSIHNLNNSIDLSGKAVSIEPITLTFTKTNNELRVE